MKRPALFASTTPTQRGFSKFEFKDRFGDTASLQESSLATERAIWFGSSGKVQVLVPGQGWQSLELPKESLVHSRMHLTQDMVRDLIPILQYFVDTGRLPVFDEDRKPEAEDV